MVSSVSSLEGHVEVEPSGDDADQLARSTKKAKMVEDNSSQEDMVVEDSQQVVVKETPLEQQGVRVETVQVPSGKGDDLSPTATCVAIKRRLISYANAFIGVNGASHEEEEPVHDFFSEEDDDVEVTEEELLAGPKKEKESDLLCPTVKVTKWRLRRHNNNGRGR